IMEHAIYRKKYIIYTEKNGQFTILMPWMFAFKTRKEQFRATSALSLSTRELRHDPLVVLLEFGENRRRTGGLDGFCLLLDLLAINDVGEVEVAQFLCCDLSLGAELGNCFGDDSWVSPEVFPGLLHHLDLLRSHLVGHDY
ncbi:hypothetical protein PMAYCL1PPCAC_01137, partial [Pristionchus mayeri]